MALRENKLKNVAMRIVIDIRERKRKPKLRDFIQKYKEKLATTDDKRAAKEEFQRKFRMLYGGSNDENAEDVKFNKLMSNFDRIQKALSHQQQAISHIVKRVNHLTERRERKEQQKRGEKKNELERKRLGLGPEPEKTPGSRHAQRSAKRGKARRKKQKQGPFHSRTDLLDHDQQRRSSEESQSDEDLTVEQKALRRANELKNIEDMYRVGKDNEEEESEQIQVLQRHAGKPKKVDDPEGFGSFRSAQLQPIDDYQGPHEDEGEDGTEQDENLQMI